MAKKEDPFKVVGKTFYSTPFYNCILSTNIAVYKYLADTLFNGDLNRIVWASTDKMFKKRQEQLAKRKTFNNTQDNLGILDIPFCSFRLSQDGVSNDSERQWYNAALNSKGMWIEELGRRVTLTPMTLHYEACFCCNHDSDLYQAQQNQIYDASAETLLESFIDATDKEGKTQTLKNIIVYSNTPHVNSQFSESDWVEKNKIQTLTIDISCLTWLVRDDAHHRYSITKKVLLDFIEGAGILGKEHHEGNVDEDAQKVIWDFFEN